VSREAELTPLPAATVALVRDTARGLEVLLLQRNFDSGFMPGMHVFPGGALDDADGAAELCARCAGVDDEQASRAIGVERGGIAYWIGAIRECFEEAGILLAYDSSGGIVRLTGAAAQRYGDHRRALDAGRVGLDAIAREEGLRLAADRLLYFSHWITPVGAPRRYDTRFFVAVAPESQEATHDNRETIAHAWMRPADALDRHGRGELKMRSPTVKTLERFAGCSTTAKLVAALSSVHPVQTLRPRITRDGRSVLPGDPGYEEAGGTEERGRWKI
jgi:8-oxo-dGTP pyrophosphatase MutT (NUDIX family)